MSEVRKTGYREQLSVYAERFGVSLRTVKRWAEKKPPFDEPELMAGWWSKNMTQRVPDSIAGGVVVVKDEREPVVVADPVEDDLPAVAPPVELLPVGDDEMGVMASLKRFNNAEVLAYRKYEEALKKNDTGEIRAALRNWNDISKEARPMVKVAREDELARRELVPRTVAEAALVEVHQPIMAGMRGLFDDICRAFGVVKSSENEARWNDLVDGVCDRLQKEVFSDCE